MLIKEIMQRALGITIGSLLTILILALGQPYTIKLGEAARQVQRTLEEAYWHSINLLEKEQEND